MHIAAATSCALVALVALGYAAPASQAATSSRPSLAVSPTRQLDPAGATVKVTGKGFDPRVGIYVALCVTPRKGQMPSPCGGGVNTSGTSPASAWISSNPPPYGTALATPFKPGGRFVVRLQISALIGSIDCRTVSCSIVTRADHLHQGDRRFDVAVPVTFRTQ